MGGESRGGSSSAAGSRPSAGRQSRTVTHGPTSRYAPSHSPLALDAPPDSRSWRFRGARECSERMRSSRARLSRAPMLTHRTIGKIRRSRRRPLSGARRPQGAARAKDSQSTRAPPHSEPAPPLPDEPPRPLRAARGAPHQANTQAHPPNPRSPPHCPPRAASDAPARAAVSLPRPSVRHPRARALRAARSSRDSTSGEARRGRACFTKTFSGSKDATATATSRAQMLTGARRADPRQPRRLRPRQAPR